MELYALRETLASDPDLQEVDIYYLEEMLQKGKGCTRLLKASSAESEEALAIKLFPKSQNNQCCLGFVNEERTITKLSHPHMVKYHNFYKDALIKGKNESFSQYSAIIMEYVPSGDLFNLVSKGSLSEILARTIFKQMISVIEYLHNQKVAHLDLKLENFLINHTGIKLIDFDGCQGLESKKLPDTRLGTVGYRPPEFVKGNYQDLRAADIYSLGIVLFTMVTGTPPYSEIEENKTYKFDQYYEALRKDVTKFWRVHEHYRTSENKDTFSKEFKQLVEGMLAEKPLERFRFEEIKRSQWFEGKTLSKEELSRSLNCHV
jgi:serine/threonine protein kinase